MILDGLLYRGEVHDLRICLHQRASENLHSGQNRQSDEDADQAVFDRGRTIVTP
jgi:hypothetical protein